MGSDYHVLKTLSDPQGGRPVEIYQRANGTFGFEEWTYGVNEKAWYPSGRYSYAVIDTLEKAEQEARSRIAWLDSNWTFDLPTLKSNFTSEITEATEDSLIESAWSHAGRPSAIQRRV